MMRAWAGNVLLLIAAPAAAQDLRELCGDRPGLGTSPCTVDSGHLQIETGLAGWTVDNRADKRLDTLALGELLARYGATNHTEVRLGWTAIAHSRLHDRTTGETNKIIGTGDVTIGIKQNLVRPSGDELSVAVLPSITLPVGKTPIGAGTWGVAFEAPLQYKLDKILQVQFTPEIDATPNESGSGRHLRYGSVVGLGIDLSEKVDLDLEMQALRDQDPDGHVTQAFVALAASYAAHDQIQIDAGTVMGLNRDSADLQLYIGLTRKF